MPGNPRVATIRTHELPPGGTIGRRKLRCAASFGSHIERRRGCPPFPTVVSSNGRWGGGWGGGDRSHARVGHQTPTQLARVEEVTARRCSLCAGTRCASNVRSPGPGRVLAVSCCFFVFFVVFCAAFFFGLFCAGLMECGVEAPGFSGDQLHKLRAPAAAAAEKGGKPAAAARALR